MPKSKKIKPSTKKLNSNHTAVSAKKKRPKVAVLQPTELEQPYHPYQPSFWKLFIKATLLAILFACIMLAITALAVGAFAFHKLQQFSKASQLSIPELTTIARQGWSGDPHIQDGKKNFLLLGTDSLATRGDEPPLTDTMMLISLDVSDGQVYTVTLPRDIWSSEYQTKINALYEFGLKRNPAHPEQFSADALSALTQVPVHRTIVVSLDTVSEVIDLLGGVEITVPDGFTDPLFPRPDVDVTKVRDPKVLYETVTFEPGSQHMNGERVLQYVRSRHSGGKTGTDNDRGARQQLVIQAIMSKILDKNTLTNIDLLGKLLHFYMVHFSSNLPITELIATGKALLPVRDKIAVHGSIISVYPENPKGVLVNPPLTKYKQWVYEIKNLEQFRREVQTDLHLSATVSATTTVQPVPTR